MPALMPIPVIDSNGDGIIDGTSISLQEAEAFVMIIGGTVAAIMAAPELTAGVVLALLVDALIAILSQEGGSSVIPQEVLDQIADIDEIIQQIASPNGTTYQRIKAIADEIPHMVHDNVTPAWYTDPGETPTPPSTGDIAAAVWHWTHDATSGMGGYLFDLGVQNVNLKSKLAWPLAGFPGFYVAGDLTYFNGDSIVNYYPFPDWGDILAQDTRLTWLQRTDTNNTWVADSFTGDPVAMQNAVDQIPLTWIGMLISEEQFNKLKTPVVPDVQVIVSNAPVWPGIANATLGDPVALAVGLTITEPMDGVLITITATEASKPYYLYDDMRGYRHIGTLAFINDQGRAEQWQDINFTSAVYSCKSMKRAAAVKIRTASGTVGTVTPWLTNGGAQ